MICAVDVSVRAGHHKITCSMHSDWLGFSLTVMVSCLLQGDISPMRGKTYIYLSVGRRILCHIGPCFSSQEPHFGRMLVVSLSFRGLHGTFWYHLKLVLREEAFSSQPVCIFWVLFPKYLVYPAVETHLQLLGGNQGQQQ